jgi:propionyl-CoA synthetase
MGRTDDIINVAGHGSRPAAWKRFWPRIRTSPNAPCSGIKDALKGEVPCGFLVLKAGVERPVADIEKEVVALVRDKLGPVAAFKLAIAVGRLPKTRSGKILRAALRGVANHEHLQTPPTIEDPAVLDELRSLFAAEPLDASSGG